MEIDEGCQRLGDMVQVYYRNAYLEKLQSTPCTPLGGVTLAVVGNLKFAVPGYSFFVGAPVQPLQQHAWDGAIGNGCGPRAPDHLRAREAFS